jgi:hypothetical protein
MLLKYSDDKWLPTNEALRLSVVGFLYLIPFVRILIPEKLRVDYQDRWSSLGTGTPFWKFTLGLSLCALLLSPLTFFLSIGLWIFIYINGSAFGHDVGTYGFISAVRLKFGANPKSLNRQK